MREICRKRSQELLVEQANFCNTFREHTQAFTEAELIGLEISHFIDTLIKRFQLPIPPPFLYQSGYHREITFFLSSKHQI